MIFQLILIAEYELTRGSLGLEVQACSPAIRTCPTTIWALGLLVLACC